MGIFNTVKKKKNIYYLKNLSRIKVHSFRRSLNRTQNNVQHFTFQICVLIIALLWRNRKMSFGNLVLILKKKATDLEIIILHNRFKSYDSSNALQSLISSLWRHYPSPGALWEKNRGECFAATWEGVWPGRSQGMSSFLLHPSGNLGFITDSSTNKQKQKRFRQSLFILLRLECKRKVRESMTVNISTQKVTGVQTQKLIWCCFWSTVTNNRGREITHSHTQSNIYSYRSAGDVIFKWGH